MKKHKSIEKGTDSDVDMHTHSGEHAHSYQEIHTAVDTEVDKPGGKVASNTSSNEAETTAAGAAGVLLVPAAAAASCWASSMAAVLCLDHSPRASKTGPSTILTQKRRRDKGICEL